MTLKQPQIKLRCFSRHARIIAKNDKEAKKCTNLGQCRCFMPRNVASKIFSERNTCATYVESHSNDCKYVFVVVRHLILRHATPRFHVNRFSARDTPCTGLQPINHIGLAELSPSGSGKLVCSIHYATRRVGNGLSSGWMIELQMPPDDHECELDRVRCYGAALCPQRTVATKITTSPSAPGVVVLSSLVVVVFFFLESLLRFRFYLTFNSKLSRD